MVQSSDYKTQDIRLAAFMKVKKAPLIRIDGDPQRGKHFCTFVFGLSDAEAHKLWLAYQNEGEQRQVDAYHLLEAYENLKTQRHKIR